MSDHDDRYDPYEDAPEWTDEDEERYQAAQHQERRRRRRRRQRWSFAVLVLLVLAAGLVGAGINQGWWQWPIGQVDEVASPTCTASASTIADPAQVRVRVLNGTEVRGLATAVGTELGARGYVVTEVGNDSSDLEVLETAQVRHGPELVAEAQSVALNFEGAVLVDDGRTNDVVDVALGTAYQEMSPADAAAAAIAAAAPTAQSGCAPGTAPTSTG